mmetsp:Transcript_147321/g.257419  ORF Transcript_147321/g.257419 Transcript_147321/m.257419 type:complete len:217 (+) Transcript_147321:262-912(+)
MFACSKEFIGNHTGSDVHQRNTLTISLGNTLDLILLFDSVRVGRSLRSVHDLVSKTFRERLDGPESSLARTSCDQIDGLVHTTKRADINGLPTHNTGGTNTGGILTGTSLGDGINQHLDGVLVSNQLNDLEGGLHMTDSHDLLTIVASMVHQSVGETLGDRALGLTETFLGPSLSGVRQVDVPLGDVVLQAEVTDIHLSGGPFLEQQRCRRFGHSG